MKTRFKSWDALVADWPGFPLSVGFVAVRLREELGPDVSTGTVLVLPCRDTEGEGIRGDARWGPYSLGEIWWSWESTAGSIAGSGSSNEATSDEGTCCCGVARMLPYVPGMAENREPGIRNGWRSVRRPGVEMRPLLRAGVDAGLYAGSVASHSFAA